MLVYIVGRTIKKTIKTERSFEFIHTKANMIIDAIGVALIMEITGPTKSLKRLNLYENIDNTIPKIDPKKNPKTILINVFPTDKYKSLVPKRLTKDFTTSSGEGNNSVLSMIILTTYHIKIQNILT
jgi:hypothetical protein